MQINQKLLIDFFRGLAEHNNIWASFFDDILMNEEVFSQKEASLLAVQKIYNRSFSKEDVAIILVESDHYTLWNKIEFNSEKEVVYVEAKDLNAAYKLGFIICCETYPDEVGFVSSSHDDSFSFQPTGEVIEEEAKQMGMKESLDNDCDHQSFYWLRFWWV